MPRERHPAALQRPADDLVDSVVTPDVFARNEQLSVGSEQTRSVQTAGSSEQSLRALEPFDETVPTLWSGSGRRLRSP